VAALRERLLAGIPEDRAARDREQQARWLLAYLLDWHRREDRAGWWEYFRLRELPEEDLLDEPQAVAGLELVERLGSVLGKNGKPTGSVVDRYRYPAQEMEIRARDDLKLRGGEGKFGEVEAVDREGRTIDVKKGGKRAEEHPSAAFAHKHVPPGVLEDALFRLGEDVAADGRVAVEAGNPLAAQLLLALPPRLRTGVLAAGPGESAVQAAVRVVGALDRTVLAIQGPPGAGKTWSGAEMICALVAGGKRVGVTATGHKVIQNLLLAVAKAARDKRLPVRLAHKPEKDAGPPPDPIVALASNEDARAALEQGTFDVVGGTAWMWARADFAGTVDVLFVDEAGQMSLANALACAQAAGSLVLLGDPQQLDQPIKGTHPDGVAASALEHVIGDHPTIPPDRGLFLPVTWRLAPSICEFTSELFYDGKLESKPGLERQVLVGAPGLEGSGLRFVPVVHDGNRSASPEEVEAVRGLVERLLASGSRWVKEDGSEAPMTAADVLVVAPYNAHVVRLEDALAASGVEVGTVDRFQGREAPAVIYTMATSRPEDAPRGLEFLYSRNRMNVATSRARCASFLVASPRLFEPECRTPRQMWLANAMCRYRELAAVVM
jgi:uncharacterized protein